MQSLGVHERTFHSLVGATMDAALEEARWPELLGALSAAVGGIGALFAGCSFAHPERGFLYISGLDPGIARLFLERHQVNPMSTAMLGQPLGRAVDQFTLVDRRVIEASLFYADVLEPQDTRAMSAIGLPLGAGLDTGGISIALDGRHPNAVRNANALLDALAPLLQRAVVTNLHIRSAKQRAHGLEAALHTMANALLLVGSDSTLLFANERATRLLARHDGVSAAGGRLVAARAADTHALHQRIGEAAQIGHRDGVPRGWGSLALARPSGKPALLALVTPVRRLQDQLALADGPAALVIVTDPDESFQHTCQSVTRLMALFGLTPMEAEVAVLVAHGLSGPQAAAKLGVGAGTVHTHLTMVFQKVGVRRQSSLARLLTRCGALDIGDDGPSAER